MARPRFARARKLENNPATFLYDDRWDHRRGRTGQPPWRRGSLPWTRRQHLIRGGRRMCQCNPNWMPVAGASPVLCKTRMMDELRIGEVQPHSYRELSFSRRMTSSPVGDQQSLNSSWLLPRNTRRGHRWRVGSGPHQRHHRRLMRHYVEMKV
ncbi:hypothetical protein BT67DRAFT_195072 [Trichocladium antarcticum]|uniref:Uncharacterized protein n=1 Tax=Trichocladium antarcticum TaxID=1450529 RepID=A0AAN6UPN2_9PEZI|nr:hypothetical protein BT67DRAFT_195072 [Trichocladium antarcticum]